MSGCLSKLLSRLADLLELQALRFKLVVGVEDAARLLNTGDDRVRELLRAGLIRQVDHLTSSKKIAIAVAELERFTAVNTDPLPSQHLERIEKQRRLIAGGGVA